MGHGPKSKNISLREQGHNVLHDMYYAGRGQSKVKDKTIQSQRINSDKTFRDYSANWDRFAKYVKDKGIKCKSLSDVGKYAQGYVDYLAQQPGKKGGHTMSASTIRSYFAPVAKICGLDYRDYKLPARHYTDYSRSRGAVASDKHFSEAKNADLVAFCRATGLRRSELEALRGKDLIDHKDGSYSVVVEQGKGGKYRESPIVGSRAEVQAVVDRMRSTGDKVVWPHINSHADIHSYRADYAQRVYEANARPVDTLTRAERFTTRGHGAANETYDRQALAAASIALGHCSYARFVDHYAKPEYDEHGKLTDQSYAELQAAAARGHFNFRVDVVSSSYLWGRR